MISRRTSSPLPRTPDPPATYTTCDVTNHPPHSSNPSHPTPGISNNDSCKLGSLWRHRTTTRRAGVRGVCAMAGRSAFGWAEAANSRLDFESPAVSLSGKTAGRHGIVWDASVQSPRWQRAELLRVRRTFARERNLHRGVMVKKIKDLSTHLHVKLIELYDFGSQTRAGLSRTTSERNIAVIFICWTILNCRDKK